MLDEHLHQIEQTMAELRHLRRALLVARSATDQARQAGDASVVCQIIESSTT